MTLEEKNKIPDAKRIEQFCLRTARNLCDELSDAESNKIQGLNDLKEVINFLDTLVRVAKMASECGAEQPYYNGGWIPAEDSLPEESGCELEQND